MLHEIKSLLKDDTTFYTLVITGVAVCSFGLGRLSVSESSLSTPMPGEQQALSGVQLRQLPPSDVSSTLPVAPSVLTGSGEVSSSSAVVEAEGVATSVVASKSGTKYHFSWCPGAKQIKDENKITFETTAAARAAGYTPAANCPGLE
jgi:hypothetical protein